MRSIVFVLIFAGSVIPLAGHASANVARQSSCFHTLAQHHVAPAFRNAACSPTLHR
ncbi:MAG TPA: hypothetical protein VKX16_02340 [Chloroflexota bacterium]|nr:hypothetical protein [Chloroflexota bacterium]